MRYRIKTHQEQIKEMEKLQQSVEGKGKDLPAISFFLIVFIILSFLYI